ncbi:hypothetical protein COL81_14490 [Bacillus toyonensis]|nr:hypothetical protein COO18_25010 [Bacillus toyonensis]PGA39145.1 hypothetical protein COL81_14490 [Bacillus toyonensis]PGC10167.1 hypothetical protein COM20_00335 [Bacillus toyonensis]
MIQKMFQNKQQMKNVGALPTFFLYAHYKAVNNKTIQMNGNVEHLELSNITVTLYLSTFYIH